jgi:hypothetical protein
MSPSSIVTNETNKRPNEKNKENKRNNRVNRCRVKSRHDKHETMKPIIVQGQRGGAVWLNGKGGGGRVAAPLPFRGLPARRAHSHPKQPAYEPLKSHRRAAAVLHGMRMHVHVWCVVCGCACVHVCVCGEASVRAHLERISRRGAHLDAISGTGGGRPTAPLMRDSHEADRTCMRGRRRAGG